MRKISAFSAALICILALPLLAQEKTLFHYPLNNGDLWEYWEGPRFFEYQQRKVIGDSLLPNGNIYKTIEIQGNLQSRVLRFQRVENNCVYQYRPRFVSPNTLLHEEFLLFKLELNLGDTWPYPGYGYQGFISDSGFVRVEELAVQGFGGRNWKGVALASYTLPDTGFWFYPDVILLDSVGVYRDAYEGGYFQLRGAIINGKQFGTITGVEERSAAPVIPTSINLKVYPNPVKSNLYAQFELSKADQIHISIFDILGRRIFASPPMTLASGFHQLNLNGQYGLAIDTLPSGFYFLVLNGKLTSDVTQRFMVVR